MYLEFYNNRITIVEGTRSQIYFGGILIDYSFDLLSLSFYAILFVFEICYLTMDLFNETNDNMVILIPRYGKKSVIYREQIIKLVVRDCILVFVNYFMFVLLEQEFNPMQDVKIIILLLIENLFLQMISYLFSFLKDSIIGYIVSFGSFFIPIMTCGFYYSIGKELWKMGHYSLLHIPLFNWHNKLVLLYLEEKYEWTANNIDLLGFKTCCLVSIILMVIMIGIGEFFCEKKQVL